LREEENDFYWKCLEKRIQNNLGSFYLFIFKQFLRLFKKCVRNEFKII